MLLFSAWSAALAQSTAEPMKHSMRFLIPGLAATPIAILALARVVASGTGVSPQGYVPLALKAPAPARSLSIATPGPKPPIGPETVTIFPNSSAFYGRGSDVVRIVGELRNNTDQVIRDVGLTYNLYMGDTLVQSRVTHVLLKHIPPHSRTCFLGRQRADAGTWDRYEIG